VVSPVLFPLSRASAFAPVSSRVTVARQTMSAKDMVGSSAPLGFFDPLGLSNKASPETLAKYRESELKHGRVAMLAVLGYLSAENWHPLYDGQLYNGNPLDSIKDMPTSGVLQIFAFCAFLEWILGDVQKNNKMPPGEFYGISARIADKDAPAWKDFQTRELNNGRAAMIGIIGEFAHTILNGKGAIAGTMSVNGHYGFF